MLDNLDKKTVEGFGEEWRRFDQSRLGDAELSDLFDRYFNVFPWSQLPQKAVHCVFHRMAIIPNILNCLKDFWFRLRIAKGTETHD